MATGSKAGLYHNAQSASYLPLTLPIKTIKYTVKRKKGDKFRA